MELMQHQKDVIPFLGSGKILHGVVGSGKSAAVLGYYEKNESPKNIFVITTAKKRDSLDWEREAAGFGIGTDPSGEDSLHGILTVDSWNKIDLYVDVKDSFFVFDEQRLVGSGTWVKSFLKIAKNNSWIMITATPGDNWMDYIPVFVANGFYKNRTQFKLEHVLYEPFVKFPKIRMYLNETKLELLRNEILVEMPYLKKTTRFPNYLYANYDEEAFRRVYKDRWNVYEDRPVKDSAEMFRLMRRVVNSDPSRLDTIRYLMKSNPRLIIFYNFNYELDILRTLGNWVDLGEWNGHRKTPIPDTKKWVYLVQYVAGAEGWNCTTTNAMVLYSLTYSYKNFMQAMGRIDRLDTQFTSLYYYILVSNSLIDLGIKSSLGSKRSFNERKFEKEILSMEGCEGDLFEFV
jgi:hypothetical protein